MIVLRDGCIAFERYANGTTARTPSIVMSTPGPSSGFSLASCRAAAISGMTTPGSLASPHGGPFRPASANTDLLGLAMQRAAGRCFADLASDLLWKPMGAEQGACIAVDRDGAPRYGS